MAEFLFFFCTIMGFALVLVLGDIVTRLFLYFIYRVFDNGTMGIVEYFKHWN